MVPIMRSALLLSLCTHLPRWCQGSWGEAGSARSSPLSCLQENQHSKKEKEEQHMAELATNAKNDEEVIAKLHKVTAWAGCDHMLLCCSVTLVIPAPGWQSGDCTLPSCTKSSSWG